MTAARSASDPPDSPTEIADRLQTVDWEGIKESLDGRGYAVLSAFLAENECVEIATLYDDETCFRRRVVMQRHTYGRGEYQYFRYPLPALVAALRSAFYRHLAAIANDWNERLSSDVRYPPAHENFLDRCHRAGQTQPTPLLLDYGPDDYNRLHQDLYGEHVFPMQLAILLSDPQSEFSGGEFVLTEQRPRTQSKVEVVPLRRGDAVIFAVNHRPEAGLRVFRRVTMRHGVSRVRSGHRRMLGIIFHDAA